MTDGIETQAGVAAEMCRDAERDQWYVELRELESGDVLMRCPRRKDRREARQAASQAVIDLVVAVASLSAAEQARDRGRG